MIRFSSSNLQSAPRLDASTALQLDALQSSFLAEASNGHALIAMSSGAFANRFGRMLGAFVSPFYCSALGLAFEVTAFEGSGRLLSANVSPETSFAQAWRNSFVNFGIMRGVGSFLQSRHFVFQHLIQDFSMVAGHQATAWLQWTPQSQESLFSQMLAAEALNLQMAAGGKLTACFTGHRLQRVEQNMERGTTLNRIARASTALNLAFPSRTSLRMSSNETEGAQDPYARLRATKEFIKGGALGRMAEGLRGEVPEEYIEAIRIQFLTNLDTLPQKAVLDLVEWLASAAPVEAPCINPALTILKSLCAGSRSFLSHVVGNEAKSQAQAGLLKVRARFYAAGSPHMERLNEIFKAFGMEIPNDALEHTYTTIDQMQAGLPPTREGMRLRIFFDLFRGENIRFQEISLNDRKALEAAWGEIPEAFERFIREYPNAASLKVYRFLLPEQVSSVRVLEDISFKSILASVLEIRAGFRKQTLFGDKHLDILPDEFNFFLIEKYFTQNPFKPEGVDHEIDGRTVRRMRRGHSYPVYDGLDPIFIHSSVGGAEEARDHDWAHILILAGYSREYVDDIMAFYDATADYLEQKGEDPHPHRTAETYEANIDVFLQRNGREDYVLAFGKILEIFPPFYYLVEPNYEGPLIVDPAFPETYRSLLLRYFPEHHPRHALIMSAWDQACRDFSSREMESEEGMMQMLFDVLRE